MKPHRATMLIVFAILGWFVCPIFAIIALVMAKTDMRAMKARRMDPSGMGTTKAAHILSLIALILTGVGIVLAVILFAVMMSAVQQQPPQRQQYRPGPGYSVALEAPGKHLQGPTSGLRGCDFEIDHRAVVQIQAQVA